MLGNPVKMQQLQFLVVDDLPVMGKVNADTLRALGAKNVYLAANGEEALDILRHQHVDFILSDWNMPVMDGLTLLRTVRNSAPMAALPFLMITAEAERSRIAEAIAVGVSDLLVKPYTAQRLHEKIVTILAREERRKMQQAAAAAAAELAARAAVDRHAAALAHANAVPGATAAPVPARAAVRPAAPLAAADVTDDLLPPDGREPVRGTILAVDDTADNLRLICHQFEKHYRVRIAHNGDKALAICQSDDPPDLVLLDVMMPGMSGFEVAQHMREHPASAGIPVIFVTTLDSHDARRHGLQLGAMDFISKPIDPELLALRVHNFMRLVEMNKQRQADYDAMLEAARLREDIDRMLRHDLKGPLAGVLGLAQLMRADPAMTKRQDDQAAMIESSVQQVLDIIALTSVVFQMETGRYQPLLEPVDMGEILHKVAHLARLAHAPKNLTFSVDTDVAVGEEAPVACGEITLCHSAFHNLVKNAAEAAPAGSTVTIRLHNQSPLMVTIENRGTVPEDMRSQLFTRYASSKRGGSGLGTYSARLMVEAQEGTISFDTSDVENRTRVYVTLPRWDMFDGAFG